MVNISLSIYLFSVFPSIRQWRFSYNVDSQVLIWFKLDSEFSWILQVITDDDVDRISLCVRVVAERSPFMGKIFTVDCRGSLSAMLEASKKEDDQLKKKADVEKALAVQADDPISFLQLLAKSDAGVFEVRLSN